MVMKNRDIVGVGCVKVVDGAIVVDVEKIIEILRRFYEKLMSEEFD